MNLTCQHCNTKLSIPDHKLPKDKEAIMKCPKCKEQIKVSSTPNPATPDQIQPGQLQSGQTQSNQTQSDQTQSDQSLEYSDEIQNQPLQSSFEDRLNALVCVGKEELKKKIYSTTKQMGIDTTIASDAKSALNKMEYHIYHLVVIDDSFDQGTGAKNVIARLNNIDMSLRRRICLVKISDDVNTNDNMTALHTSVNAIIHINDVIHIEAFLSKVISEHKNVYTVYNESLKLAGKA